MDLGGEAVLTLRGCSPLPTCQNSEAGVMHATEDPRLLRPKAIPARECSRKAARNVPATGRNYEKDVKIDGTNSISPVESAKVPKNELKTNWKNVLFIREKPSTNRKSDPKKAS